MLTHSNTQRILGLFKPQPSFAGLPMLTGFLTNAAVLFIGGEIFRLLDPSSNIFALSGNSNKKGGILNGALLGLGGTAVAGRFIKGHQEGKLEQARLDDQVAQVQELLSTREKELAEAKNALTETQSNFQELQERLDDQYTSFQWMCLALLACLVGLIIAFLCQRLIHSRDRHSMTVAHNLEREKALQEKLRQQRETMDQQRASLSTVNDERRLQLQLHNMQHAASIHPTGHQPLVFTLPPGLIAPATATATAEQF